MANNPPRNIDIKGQDHMLAYITPEEGGILQLLGGSGAPGPMGIPSFFMDFGMDSPSSETGGGSGPDSSDYNDDGSDSFDYYAGSDNRPSSVLTDSNSTDSQITDLIDSGTFNPSNRDYNTMDFGRGSVSNVSNMSNYDPNFAALDKVSRGLDPRGLKDFEKTSGLGFDSRVEMNPLAQIDPRSALGQRHLQAQIDAKSLSGPFRGGQLNNLTLAEIDKLDPADLAQLYASQDISRQNAYGTKNLPGIGLSSMLANFIGGGDPTSFNYGQSDKDSIQTGRGKLAYGTVPGQDASNYGQVGAITDKLSKDFSGITSGMSDAFTQVSDAVKEMLGFAKDSRGGYTDEDFGRIHGGRGFPMEDNINNNDRFLIDDFNNDDSTPKKIRPTGDPSPVDPEQYVGKSFLPSNIDNLLNSNKVKQDNTENIIASSSRKPVDFSAIDEGLGSVRSGIANINRNRYS